MPLPAGTGLTRRKFVAQSLGARAVGLRRRPARSSSTRASRTPRPVKHSPILVSVFLQGGADSLSLLYPEGDPLYQKLRTDLAVTGGTPFTEDPRLYWNPALVAARAAARRGQGHRAAGDRLRPSRPVALHLAPLLGGRRHRPAAADGLARPLPRRRGRRRTTRCRASRSPAASSRRSRPPRCRSRRSTARTSTASARRASGAASQNRMLDAMGALGSVHSRDPAFAHRGERDEAVRPPAPPAAPVREAEGHHLAGRRTRRATTASRPGCRASPR